MEKINDKNITNLAQIFNTHKKIHGHVSLDENLDSHRLLKIVVICNKEPYFYEVCELVIAHPNVDSKIYQEVYKLSNDNVGLLNALATSKKCPTSIIEKLIKSPIKSVSEHAQLNFFAQTLRSKSENELHEVLDKHNGDSTLDLGIRSALAYSNKTPEGVLQRLVSDDIDAIAVQAKKTLLSKK